MYSPQIFCRVFIRSSQFVHALKSLDVLQHSCRPSRYFSEFSAFLEFFRLFHRIQLPCGPLSIELGNCRSWQIKLRQLTRILRQVPAVSCTRMTRIGFAGTFQTKSDSLLGKSFTVLAWSRHLFIRTSFKVRLHWTDFQEIVRLSYFCWKV